MRPAAIEHLRAAYDLAARGGPRSRVALALGRTLVASRLSEGAGFLAAAIDEAAENDPGARVAHGGDPRERAAHGPGLGTERVGTRSRPSPRPTGRSHGGRAFAARLHRRRGDGARRADRRGGPPRHGGARRRTAAEGRDVRVGGLPVRVHGAHVRGPVRPLPPPPRRCARRRTCSRVRARVRVRIDLRAEAAFGAGDLREAEADARAALEPIDERPAIVAAPLAAGWLALALIEQGRTAEAAAVLAARDRGDAHMPQAVHAPLKHARGMHALAVLDAERAKSVLQQAGDDLRASLCPTPTCSRGVPRRPSPRPCSAVSRGAQIRGRGGAPTRPRDACATGHRRRATRAVASSGRRPAASSGCAPRWPRSRTPRRASTTLTAVRPRRRRFVSAPPPGATRVSRCVSRPTSPQSAARRRSRHAREAAAAPPARDRVARACSGAMR